MILLEFEKKALLECLEDNCLILYANGLGIDRLFYAHLKAYNDPTCLVLVLNTSKRDQEFLIERFRLENVKPLPKVIGSEIGAAERRSVYLEGGVQFVTSRILVGDLLTNRVPVEMISGILIYKLNTYAMLQQGFL